MEAPTYAEIASNWSLWADYVDPSASMTEAEFDSMSIEEKIATQVSIFGPEPEVEDDYEPNGGHHDNH